MLRTFSNLSKTQYYQCLYLWQRSTLNERAKYDLDIEDHVLRPEYVDDDDCGGGDDSQLRTSWRTGAAAGRNDWMTVVTRVTRHMTCRVTYVMTLVCFTLSDTDIDVLDSLCSPTRQRRKAVVTTTILCNKPIRQRNDHWTTYITTELLHCNL